MSGIFDLVRIQNHEIVAQSLEAMISIVDSNYQFMEPYLNQLYDMTSMLMSKAGQNDEEDDKLARLSIEVWNSLCEVEILRSKSPRVPDLQIVKNSDWQKLATLFCNNLIHTGFDESDHSIDDDNDMAVCV